LSTCDVVRATINGAIPHDAVSDTVLNAASDVGARAVSFASGSATRDSARARGQSCCHHCKRAPRRDIQPQWTLVVCHLRTARRW
jgi:hypothetical protein